ncbi:c-type cytochrome [Roseobacter sp. MH60115]|uniref:c-type cytochrome n=1 Tax=Roseobacter sp. MH60115 TaxID=2785324 RepID=UPI0018A325C9|nr:c-type cytochrome [Roseobacter sp. MH60115]
MFWRFIGLGVIGALSAGAAAACTAPEPGAGDVEYGAYLAGECVTCHRPVGSAAGIPVITGLAASDFVAALQAYRCGTRRHAVMEMVARRLGDAEIAALAAYFGSLD